jgi:hypothetical protein
MSIPLWKETRFALVSRSRKTRTAVWVWKEPEPRHTLCSSFQNQPVLSRQAGILGSQVSPFRAEIQRGVAGEKAGGGYSGQMVSLMPIREMAHYHHLVISITGVPTWTPTRTRPLNAHPSPLLLLFPHPLGVRAVPCLFLYSGGAP